MEWRDGATGMGTCHFTAMRVEDRNLVGDPLRPATSQQYSFQAKLPLIDRQLCPNQYWNCRF
jgi:hypothetical protein